ALETMLQQVPGHASGERPSANWPKRRMSEINGLACGTALSRMFHMFHKIPPATIDAIGEFPKFQARSKLATNKNFAAPPRPEAIEIIGFFAPRPVLKGFEWALEPLFVGLPLGWPRRRAQVAGYALTLRYAAGTQFYACAYGESMSSLSS